MALHRFLILLTTALVVLLGIVVWFFPSNDDFRIENPFWNGISDISSLVPVTPLSSLFDLPDSPQQTTLILIPYLDFTPDELDKLNGYVSRGGTLILADDYGYGNRVLEYWGLKGRFSGKALLDPLFNRKNKWFPRISHLASSSITNNTESLVLNHATGLTGVDDSEALALSSSFSFVDLNGDEAWDEGEPTGPVPVISSHGLAGGQVILVSDPSIFINSMETIEDNYDFIQNIRASTSTLFMDQSHLPPSNLHQTKSLLLSIRDILVTPVGTLVLVVLVLAITLIPIWHGREKG